MKPFTGFRGSPSVSVGAALLAILHVSTAFQCDSDNNPYNCSCIHSEDYELECPPLGDDLRLLRVQISWDQQNTSSEVSCRNNATASDFRLLDGINITSLQTVHFKICPLPRVPFRQVFQLQNPLDLTELGFYGRDQSENLTFQLEGLTNLETLDISDNSFRDISAETLGDVPNLTSLVLRSNRLTTISKEAMDKVPKLTSLELGKNRIASLSPGVFSSLTSLKRLLLYRNELGNSTLSSDIFEGLGNVEILDLRSNNLASIAGDFLKHLVKLKELDLSNNKFESLPDGLLKTAIHLESFKLFGNKASNLVIPEGLFENLSALKQINMDGSNIETLPENIFRNATALVTISLKGNRLKELPVGIFRDTINVQNLYLQENKISELPSQVFVALGELQILDLSQNQIVNITEEVFWKTAKLETLNIHSNGLRHLDKRAFQRDTCKIRTIDLSNNLLTFPNRIIGDDLSLINSPLSSCRELIDIDLSNNSITTIFADWKFTFTSLKKLNLTKNKISLLDLADNGFGSEALIDVENNNISVVVLHELDDVLNLSDDGDLSPPVKIKVLLSGNPISCDCHNYDLLRYFERKLDPKVYDKLDLKADNLICASPRAFKERPIAAVPSREVTCPLIHKPHSAPCPMPCECKIRTEDRALLVQCAGAHLTSAPDELPSSEDTNHTELNISHNAITSLPLLTQPGYGNVTKLFASHNRISRLNVSSLPSTLQVLELDHNNFTMLQPRVVEYITNLTNLSSVTLHNNSWDCQCGSLHFVNFVQFKFKQIPFLKEVKCSDGRTVSNLTASGLCPNVSAILWVVIVGAVCIVICGLVIAYYRYQQEIKVWLFAHRMCLWWVTEQELDRDKRYDAFICFSHKDQDFVDGQLVPNLESGPTPFKLCIHTRDFIPGEWITNQIISAVENSRRTIIVLSPNFVESEWGRMEFRTAHAQAMSEGRARVIVILYGDIGPTEKLEPELRAYLNMNTYVKWGDPWFWDKLRYALPHPPELLKNPAMAFVRQASLRRKPLEDRLELICDPNSPSVIVSPTCPENEDTAINNEKNAKMNENGKIPTQPKAVPAS